VIDFRVAVHEGAGTTEEIGDGCRIAFEAASITRNNVVGGPVQLLKRKLL